MENEVVSKKKGHKQSIKQHVKLTEDDIRKCLVKGKPRIHKTYGLPSFLALYMKMFNRLFEMIVEDIVNNNDIYVVKEKPFIKMWIGKMTRKETTRTFYANVKSDLSILNYRYNVMKMNYYKKKGTRVYHKRIKIPKRHYDIVKTRNYFLDEL